MALKNSNKKESKTTKGPTAEEVAARALRYERIRLTLGFGMLIFLLFLSLSFLSFLFTGASDHSKLDLNFWEMIKDADLKVSNWTGKIGAWLSELFINQYFGLGSFILLYFPILIALKLITLKNYAPLLKSAFLSLVGAIWISLFFGFFFIKGYEHSFLFLGGKHGYMLSNWMISAIGWFGTFSIILITFTVYYIYNFKDSTRNIKRLLALKLFGTKNETALEINEEVVEKLKPLPNNLMYNDPQIEEDDDVDVSPLGEDFYRRMSNNKFEVTRPEEEQAAVRRETPTEAPIFEHKEAKSENIINEEIDLDIEEKIEEEELDHNLGEYDPTLDLSRYKYPPLDLLVDYKSDIQVTEEELIGNKKRIVQTLENYGITIDSIKATIGPTITLYEIVPAAGVRIAKIKNLEDDIALSLSALGIRIIAPIPGKGTIGIEVPNREPEVVSMRSVIASKRFQEAKYELPVALGKTITNETFVFDLVKMPHLLVAGATGQGKSVGINAILTSLLFKKHPAQLKFVLVDPKKVELSIYSRIEKHFLAKLPDMDEPIITDVQKVVNTLNSLTIEMDNRYDMLKKAHVRNIREYNHKFVKRQLNPENGHAYLPYIVLVIDEFADLIMTAGKEVELPIARIAQLARAVGIHMIIATQRPSTNIITGVIKANFPARIAFKVSAMVDSRTILDSPGANQLVGRGDMLITQNSELVRLQCAFIDTPEVEEIVKFISEQQGYPTALLLPEFNKEEGGSSSDEDPLENIDSMFVEAARIVVANQSGSTSLLQRRFSIGYNRAGRIMDQLEAASVVGAFEGSKARKVLIGDEYSLEQHLKNMGL